MYSKNDRHRLFNTISVPIMIVDANCHILDANRAVSTWINRPKNRIIGQKCYQLSTENDSPCWETNDVTCPIKLSLESKRPTRLIHEKKFGGQTVIEEVVATPIYNDVNEIDYIVLELTDISELLNTKEVVTYLKNEVNTLRTIIPLCASCKKIRDDDGFWQNVENYLTTRIDVQFSHSMCPKCMKTKHPEICDLEPDICREDSK